jgi:hypothetical protein
MENSSQTEEKLVRIPIEGNFKLVSAITDEYKILNKNLLEYISIFETIFQQENVHLNDYKRLSEINIEFNSYEFDHPLYIVYGFNIKSNILNATLIETYIKAHDFFRNQFCGLWYNQMEIYKIKLIELGTEIDAMLMLLEMLYGTLDMIHMDFNSVIKEIDLLNDYVYDTFDFKFKFENYTKLSTNYHDLNTQKKVFIKAIRDAKMHKIEKTLSEKDETDYQIFVQKCIEAIKVIEFEIMANDHPIDDTMKYFEMNNTSLNQKIEDEIDEYQPYSEVVPINPTQVEKVPTTLKTEISNPSTIEIKPVKTFPDYLLHIHNEKLAEGLKKQFSTGKGKKIRTMLEGLKQITPPIFTLSSGENNEFFSALSGYFKRDIGTYASIFNSAYDKSDEKEKASINDAIKKINHVLTTLPIQ